MPRTSKSGPKATSKPKSKSKSPPIDPNAVTLGIHLLKYGNGRVQVDVTTEHTCVHAHLDKGLAAFDGIFKDMFKSLPMMGPVLAQVMGKGGPGAGAGGQGSPPVQEEPTIEELMRAKQAVDAKLKAAIEGQAKPAGKAKPGRKAKGKPGKKAKGAGTIMPGAAKPVA